MQINTLCIRSFYGLLFLLLGSASTIAQGKLELKANVLPILASRAELSGEYLINFKFGIEAGIGYNKLEDTKGELPQKDIWTSQLLNLYLSGKYYFSPKHRNDRFFVGVIADYYNHISYQLNGVDIDKPGSNLGLGLEPGFKWVIREKLLIEASIRGLFYLEEYSYGGRVYNFDTMLNGKIGYRF